MNNKKTVSLVLSCGGARGYSHIGVIEVLNEKGYKINAISGSSMGAVIGGIYATGKLNVYKEWVTSLDKFDVIKMLDISFTRKGLFKGDKIIQYLEEIIGDTDIENLPINFTAVAVDIVKQKEVWFSSGSLFEAIRASIAIPTLFTPLEKDNMVLLDGGLLNPIPIAPLLNKHNDLIIAVNVNGNNPPDPTYYPDIPDKIEYKSMSFLNIMSTSISIMQASIGRFKLASYSPDIIIEIPKDYCNVFDFHKAKEMIEIGRVYTEKELKNFELFVQQNNF